MTQDELLKMLGDSPYATIPDISHWQDWFDIEAAKAEAALVLAILDGVMIKAGGGVVVDKDFEANYQELVDHPAVLRGVYWYFYWWIDWEAQVFALLQTLAGKDIDYIEWDVEDMPVTTDKRASYSITAIRSLKRIQLAYPSTRVIPYLRKELYEILREYSAEWDQWPYHHAQYYYSTWYTVTQPFLDWWYKVIIKRERQPNLPASRSTVVLPVHPYEKHQVVAKSGLGDALGVGSKDIDISITRRTKEEFIKWIGRPARWDGTPAPPEPPSEGDHMDIFHELTDKFIADMKAAGYDVQQSGVLTVTVIPDAPHIPQPTPTPVPVPVPTPLPLPQPTTKKVVMLENAKYRKPNMAEGDPNNPGYNMAGKPILTYGIPGFRADENDELYVEKVSIEADGGKKYYRVWVGPDDITEPRGWYILKESTRVIFL